MAFVDLSNIIVAFKAQTFGTPESGAGAFGIEVLPSSGLARQVASIESGLIKSNRMKRKPRHGTTSASAAYETELINGALDDVFEAVLGGTWVAEATLDETDFTSLTITGTGTIITAASGDLISLGVRAGMMCKLAGMSVTANDDVWFPVLTVGGANNRVITLPTGILADNATDTACDLIIARHVFTADPYTKRYFTGEEYWGSAVDQSKLGTDLVFNQLAMDCAVDTPIKASFSLVGRDMTILATGDAPNFTSPTFTAGNAMVLLDGGLYLNGVRRANVTGFQWGLAAPATAPGSIGSRTPVDVSLGQFALTGQMLAYIETGADFELAEDETNVSIILHCAEREGDPADFTTIYLGNLSLAGVTSPAGGEGLAVATIAVYGGDDDRGAGFQQTTVLISTSAA